VGGEIVKLERNQLLNAFVSTAAVVAIDQDFQDLPPLPVEELISNSKGDPFPRILGRPMEITGATAALGFWIVKVVGSLLRALQRSEGH
jgi:hypothetical protein